MSALVTIDADGTTVVALEAIASALGQLAGDLARQGEEQAAKLDEVLELLGPLCATVAQLEQLVATLGPMLSDPSGPMRMLAGLMGAGRQ